MDGKQAKRDRKRAMKEAQERKEANKLENERKLLEAAQKFADSVRAATKNQIEQRK